jgi:hypothetical protein
MKNTYSFSRAIHLPEFWQRFVTWHGSYIAPLGFDKTWRRGGRGGIAIKLIFTKIEDKILQGNGGNPSSIVNTLSIFCS